jgi:transposase
MSKVYIGIDLAAKYCWGATRNQEGELLNSERFKTSEKNLTCYVEAQKGEATVLMEECDLAGWAQRVLIGHAEKVAVCEPRANLWIHRDAVKTDKIDAAKLADIARLGNYKEVYHTDDERIYELQVAVRAYERLAKKVKAQKNQIKAELRGEGVICAGARIFGKRGREEAMALLRSPLLREILSAEYEHLDFLLRSQARAGGRFVRLGAEIGIVRAWQAMPGMGPVGAARFCACVKCPHRFANKGQLSRYSRLGVTQHETGGKSIRRQHLDPAGNGALKDISNKAFRAALRTRGDNLIKRSYARSLARTGDEVHARLNVQRKILAIMWAMWRDGTAYDDDMDMKNGACGARL